MKISKILACSLGICSLTPCIAATIATVNGVAVTKKSIESTFTGLTQGQRDSMLRDPVTRKNIVEGAIDQEILAQEARKLKINNDPEFREMLQTFERQAMGTVLLQRKWAAKLTPSAVRKYYDEHLGLFSTDQVHIQHILTQSEPEARKYLAMAKAPGADFQKLAEEYSRAPQAKNDRGDIGFINRTRFVPEFTEPVFAAQVGTILGPIHTAYGYHIVKVIEKKPGKALEFSEVEIRARELLRAELSKEYLEQLRKQSKVVLSQDEINKL